MGIEKSQPKSIRIEGLSQAEINFLFIETATVISTFCQHMLDNKKRLNGILNEVGISYDDFVLNAYKLKTIASLNGGE